MSNLERWLWAGDFVISGIGWFFGGPYAALLCFAVAGLLIFIALTKKEQGESKHRILIDERTAYIRGVKRWHKWGIGISIICVLGLISYGIVKYGKKPLPVAQSGQHATDASTQAQTPTANLVPVAPQQKPAVTQTKKHYHALVDQGGRS
ncbi:MAG TPA: hypothetical protein VI386_10475 [Candidatus Sulfotelmatobacter sp.]